MYISQGYIKKKSEFEKMETESFDKIYLQSMIKVDHWFETFD